MAPPDGKIKESGHQRHKAQVNGITILLLCKAPGFSGGLTPLAINIHCRYNHYDVLIYNTLKH